MLDLVVFRHVDAQLQGMTATRSRRPTLQRTTPLLPRRCKELTRPRGDGRASRFCTPPAEVMSHLTATRGRPHRPPPSLRLSPLPRVARSELRSPPAAESVSSWAKLSPGWTMPMVLDRRFALGEGLLVRRRLKSEHHSKLRSHRRQRLRADAHDPRGGRRVSNQSWRSVGHLRLLIACAVTTSKSVTRTPGAPPANFECQRSTCTCPEGISSITMWSAISPGP